MACRDHGSLIRGVLAVIVQSCIDEYTERLRWSEDGMWERKMHHKARGIYFSRWYEPLARDKFPIRRSRVPSVSLVAVGNQFWSRWV